MNNNSGFRQILLLLLAGFLLTALFCAASAETGLESYSAYLDACSGRPSITDPLVLYSSDGEALNEGDAIPFSFSVAQDGFGYPVLTYRMTGNNILDNVYSLLLDGETPYAECGALKLESQWLMEGPFDKDRYGNEVVSMPVKDRGTLQCRMLGKAGLYSRGMGLYLTAGEHTITLLCREGPFELLSVAFTPEISPESYRVEGSLTGRRLITIQAENVPARNNPNVRPAADYDLRLTPYSNREKVMNYIEDISYHYALDTLTYGFSVEEEGFYALALRLRQTELANFPVFRTFYVDGKIPSAAFEDAAFSYCLNFENQTVKDENGEPALLYLSAGEHTLTIQTSLDPLRPAVLSLNRISDEMAALALDITKITGGNTDFFRDFSLLDFDFHIAEDLQRWVGELKEIRVFLCGIVGGEGRIGALSSLDMAIDTLQLLARKPDDLPKKLGQFSQGASSARSFLVNMTESLQRSGMGLDSIHFYTDESMLPQTPDIAEQVGAAAQRFGASFGDQGYAAGNEAEEGTLQVWVNRPRQYLEILQRMADTSFTPRTGVKVDFSIMPDESKLVLANASGSAPDVALGVSSGRTYDLAVRGALKNLRDYENLNEVGRWFPTGLLIPGVCDEGLYALPETFNFYVLFYRKDILDNIGIPVPDSYEEVLNLLPTLQRFGLNYNNFVANVIGYKTFSITTPFIFQAGGKLYENGNIHILLDEPEAIRGLQTLTDSFIIYDMAYEINSFYQSFRDGTLPIGTANYGMYNLLMNAAPELSDRWGVALYPGITDENGTVQRWTSGAEQSCFIFSSTQMEAEAWQFLTWWMSEETQTEFAFTLQSTLGNEYLWNSANTSAFANSPWPTEHKKIIAEQMQWIYEAPRVPGSYMVEREISNAINSVCLEGKNLREALDEAVKRIDREVERKLEEFGRLENGRLTAPFLAPDPDMVKEWLK